MDWLALGVDMIFCNLDEAKIFSDSDDDEKAVQTLLDYVSLAVVTNGKNPTHLAQKLAENISIEKIAVPSAKAVVDTNGAGDNFAGAFLYGLTQGLDLKSVSCWQDWLLVKWWQSLGRDWIRVIM